MLTFGLFHLLMKVSTRRLGNGLYEGLDRSGKSWWLARDEKTGQWEARLTSTCIKPASTRDQIMSKLASELGPLQFPK